MPGSANATTTDSEECCCICICNRNGRELGMLPRYIRETQRFFSIGMSLKLNIHPIVWAAWARGVSGRRSPSEQREAWRVNLDPPERGKEEAGLRCSRVVKKLSTSSFWSCSTAARRDEARPTQARSMSLIVKELVMALADDITVRRGHAEDSAQGVTVPKTANQSPQLQRESGGCHPGLLQLDLTILASLGRDITTGRAS